MKLVRMDPFHQDREVRRRCQEERCGLHLAGQGVL